MTQRPDVENIPNDLDRFLRNFFSRGWRSEIEFDPAQNLLFLVVHLGDQRLSSDDRFFSLVEHFVRSQSDALHRSRGPRLRCRMISADGRDLTLELRHRGAQYLDDGERGSKMRRRLTLLGMRRRLLRRLVPDALLWAAAFVFITLVVGLPLDLAIGLGAAALVIQMVVVSVVSRRGP